MSARIIDRGRGPEVEGTRVTVYRIMDYLCEESTPERIAEELDLTDDQVQAALIHIGAHRAEVEAEYQKILFPWQKAPCLSGGMNATLLRLCA